MPLPKEFPDYDPATLPTIPAEWVDISWHNDACPTWQSQLETAGFIVLQAV